jgi:hypothetical protein
MSLNTKLFTALQFHEKELFINNSVLELVSYFIGVL